MGPQVQPVRREAGAHWIRALARDLRNDQMETYMLTHPKDRSITPVDSLYELAVRIVLEERVASVSLVQRRLRLGYGRTVKMLERMAAEGLVSAHLGSDGFRELLISPFRRRQLLQQLLVSHLQWEP